MPTKLESLKALVKKFEALQAKYAKFGARDTEPDGVFQARLMRALGGKRPSAPNTPSGWQLYSDSKGAGTAASALELACNNCIALIESCTVAEVGEVRTYLESYCWRVG